MIDEATYEQLDRYAAGKMNTEERAAFDARLSQEEALRDELAWLLAATAALAMNGKTILEKQLAEVFAAVPDAALEKYAPSLPKKSFLKKWWLAIAGVVVIAAGLAAWWFLIHRSNGGEGGHDMPEPSIEQPDQQQFSNPGVPGASPPADSCVDSLSSGKEASTGILFGEDENAGGKKSAEKTEVVRVTSRERGYIYDADEPKQPGKSTRVDSSPAVWTASSVVNIGAAVSDSITKQRPMDVTFRPTDAAPTYFFTDKLILCGSYRNAEGLHFSGQGDTVIMTDGKPGYFVLVKGPGEKPLVRSYSRNK